MKTKEEKQKKFVTEFEINGRKYAGEIWAISWDEADNFVKQRAATEKVVGVIPRGDYIPLYTKSVK